MRCVFICLKDTLLLSEGCLGSKVSRGVGGIDDRPNIVTFLGRINAKVGDAGILKDQIYRLSLSFDRLESFPTETLHVLIRERKQVFLFSMTSDRSAYQKTCPELRAT